MKNVIKSLCVLTAAAAVLAFAGQSVAFCVHNYTDVDMSFVQESGDKFGRGYSKIINPGGSGCCNWQNTDCNKEGHKDSMVGITAQYGSYPTGRVVCLNKKIPACSDLDVIIKDDKYECVAHGMDTCN